MRALPTILTAIREQPDDGPRWLPLAGWLWDNGRDDESAAVRVFWTTLRDNVTVAGVSVEQTLRELAQHAAMLGRRAREIEARRWDGPANE
jgi:hypothetical protein